MERPTTEEKRQNAFHRPFGAKNEGEEAMAEKLTQSKVLQVLDWGYEKAVDGGMPGMDTARELASGYARKYPDAGAAAAESLIRWQVAKCATSGFITGVGGLVTLPVAVPANVASVMYIQLRMIAAVAHLGGYDLRDDAVQSLVYICMAGKTASDIAKGVGIVLGEKLAVTTIKRVFTRPVLTKINQAVGFRLVTQFGSKGVVNLGRMVPIVGGVVCGTFDAVTTRAVGDAAKKTFVVEASAQAA